MKSAHFLFLAALALAQASARTDELTLKVIEKNPPAAVSAAIADELSKTAIQLLEQGGEPAFEFWFRSAVPLKSAPATPSRGLDAIREAELLGVASIPKDRRDYRDDELYSGVHTIRFALQPQDGNHLGTSDFTFYAVLVPAERDLKVNGIRTYDDLVKISSEDTASEHPVIMSLRPPASAGGPFPSLQEPKPEHKSLRLKIPGVLEGGKRVEILFELVYEGFGEL